MRIYALQKGPCSFLKLRISPWEIPSVLLLCSPLSWHPFSFPHRQLHPSVSFLPPSLCSLRSAWTRGVRRQAPARGSERHAGGAGGTGARMSAGASSAARAARALGIQAVRARRKALAQRLRLGGAGAELGWRSGCGLAAQQEGRLRWASGSGSGDAGGVERADAGAREACASARRPEQSEQGERARRRRRAARWSGRPRARGDVAARVSAGSAAGGRGGGVAVQSDGARRRSCGGGLLREMRNAVASTLTSTPTPQ
jgi:hypothetical protein